MATLKDVLVVMLLALMDPLGTTPRFVVSAKQI